MMAYLRERTVSLLLVLLFFTTAEGWIAISPSATRKYRPYPVVGAGKQNRYQSTTPTRIFSSEKNTNNQKDDNDDDEGGVLDFIFNPYVSKIPKEIKDEIYQAEGNTQAAKERGTRIALYAFVAFVGVLCAFFNGFLTELRKDGGIEVLEEVGFGWANSNFLFQFLFLNKVGGLVGLLGGAGAGLLAEAEFDTRRINAEKIYEELERRKEKKMKKKQKKLRKGGAPMPSKKKKRRSGKERKRLEALGEVVLPTTEEKELQTMRTEEQQQENPIASTGNSKNIEDKEDGGIFGSLKQFYEKADNMAETQALLLNKKLEDEGVLEKITDESGFKVIGREEASKLQKMPKEEAKDDDAKKEKS